MMDASNLVWLDLEMTGLDADKERIIEAAMIVTDTNLNILAQSPIWVVHQSDALLAAMDEWNTAPQSLATDALRESGQIEETREANRS